VDWIQIDALEVEAKSTSTGKSRSRTDFRYKKRGKEEASSSSIGRESQEHRIKEMDNLIKKLSRKMKKMEF